VGTRRRGRQRAVQILYEWTLMGRSMDVIAERLWRARDEPAAIREFAESLARGTADNADHIDQLIDYQAVNWRLDRLSNVDRNVLRLGVYELLNEPDTPPAVVIDEAIELGKRFSGPSSGQFINGILDGIRKRLEAPGGVPAPDEDEDSEEVDAE
jgi:N utilization substance protein B